MVKPESLRSGHRMRCRLRRAIFSTSPGKYQVFWRVDGFDFEHQEQALKLLAIAFGGDPACTDCNRVLRLPGFLNRKYDPAHLVTVEYPCDSVWNSGRFQSRHRTCCDALPFRRRDPVSGAFPAKNSHSESDWAWVLRELAHGEDAAKLTQELASAAPINPILSTTRSAPSTWLRLGFGLSKGMPIDDVITMLEVRRSSEIPRALCSARAREIATTAQRMITRKRIALIHHAKENAMPLLEVTQARQISTSIRLTDTTAILTDRRHRCNEVRTRYQADGRKTEVMLCRRLFGAQRDDHLASPHADLHLHRRVRGSFPDLHCSLRSHPSGDSAATLLPARLRAVIGLRAPS